MSQKNKQFSIYFVTWLLMQYVNADSDVRLTEHHKTKLTDHFTRHGISCITEYTISFDDIKALKDFRVPKSPKAPCFFACILKRAEMMNAEGKITPEAVMAVAKTVFEDEKDVNEAVKVFEACAYVNDKEVSDGSKGCDRAMMALTCLMEQCQLEDVDIIDGKTSMVSQRKTARLIIGNIFTSLLQLACDGFAKVKDIIPFKALTDLLPFNTVATLCSIVLG